MNNSLTIADLDWNNVVGFSSDNCNVMIGRRNSVLSKSKEKSPHIYSVGCPSHLVNICAKAAYKELTYNPELLVIDIYYYFEKSSKRREDLKEFKDFCNVAQQRVMKHCPTRWLSPSFTKVLEKFPLEDVVINNLNVLLPTSQDNLTCDVVHNLSARFPQCFSAPDIIALEEEVLDYQATHLPTVVNRHDSMLPDEFWYKVSGLTNVTTGAPRFPLLAKLMKLLIILPHSNCDVERAFSVMGHIKIQYRASLSHKTLVNLMSCKLNLFSNSNCYSLKVNSAMLRATKVATTVLC